MTPQPLSPERALPLVFTLLFAMLPAGALEASETALTHPSAQTSQASQASKGWWTESVWNAPDRPFLYYGKDRMRLEEKKKETPAAAPAVRDDPDDFSRLKTMAEVRSEYSSRLDRAVMEPTPKNVAALQAISVYIFGKSQSFAEAFERSRLANPRYDWTASRPSANFAVVELEAKEDRLRAAFFTELARGSGLIFVGGPEAEKNALALGPVRAFARAHGFKVLAVETSAPVPAMEGVVVRPENGIAKRIGDPALGPMLAILADPKSSASPAVLRLRAASRGAPLLFSTGVASVEELRRRLLVMLAPPPESGSDARTLLMRATSFDPPAKKP